MIDYTNLKQKIDQEIKDNTIPWLKKFVNIPNTSREFDPAFFTNGLIQNACNLCVEYAKFRNVKGLEVKLYEEEGKTPIVFGTIAATNPDKHKSIMVYGHIDKQPHLAEGWSEGLFPAQAVERDGLLYGRGGVDDGYNFFTIVSIIKVLQEAGISHDRIILFYETDEESASKDIPHYLDKFKATIGNPDAMFCLDSGSISPNVFSITSTLRGCLNFELKVRILEKGIHSGMGSGIVPSTFRIARHLLNRIENETTGRIIDQLQVTIPEDKVEQAKFASNLMGKGVFSNFKFAGKAHPVSEDVYELYTNNVWRPQLEIIGQRGIPLTHESGNVLRDETVLRCSLRLPPTLKWDKAFEIVKGILEKDPPYNAQVSIDLCSGGNGWNSNEVPQGVMNILNKHNEEIFGGKTLMYGMGGSIPFISVLQDNMPNTLLFVSGIVLPDSNIHGPNESCDLKYLSRFAQSMACFFGDYHTL